MALIFNRAGLKIPASDFVELIACRGIGLSLAFDVSWQPPQRAQRAGDDAASIDYSLF
ncbi:hypothetical protein V1291_000999 [Nitrobacteraceae bacterium AZCC 1564]